MTEDEHHHDEVLLDMATSLAKVLLLFGLDAKVDYSQIDRIEIRPAVEMPGFEFTEYRKDGTVYTVPLQIS